MGKNVNRGIQNNPVIKLVLLLISEVVAFITFIIESGA